MTSAASTRSTLSSAIGIASRHRIFPSPGHAAPGLILDAGCGSSLTVQSLNNVVGMDFNFGKLRFLRRYGMPLVRGSAFALPFRSELRLRRLSGSHRAPSLRRGDFHGDAPGAEARRQLILGAPDTRPGYGESSRLRMADAWRL